nr:Glutaredoxin-related protein [Ipomoea batatas]
MWLSRTKSKTGIHRTTSANFSCSSFKDIQTLCADEPVLSSDSPTPTQTKKSSNIFHRAQKYACEKPEPSISLPGSENRIVVYLTSLRVVRRTFLDCKDVQAILRSFRVSIDERDLSMDGRFMDELRAIMGVREKRKLTLPRVFIGGRYIGGAEEIRQMHEAGELKQYVEGLPPAKPGTCEVCGGHRFLLCADCDGSRKYYSEKAGFRVCKTCNENGLIRAQLGERVLSFPKNDQLERLKVDGRRMGT